MTAEEDVYDLLGVEVNTDKKSGKVTLTQGDFNNKVPKKMGMLDMNNNTTTVATMTLETDNDGYPFDDTWKYASVVGMMMYLSRNPSPYI